MLLTIKTYRTSGHFNIRLHTVLSTTNLSSLIIMWNITSLLLWEQKETQKNNVYDFITYTGITSLPLLRKISPSIVYVKTNADAMRDHLDSSSCALWQSYISTIKQRPRQKSHKEPSINIGIFPRNLSAHLQRTCTVVGNSSAIILSFYGMLAAARLLYTSLNVKKVWASWVKHRSRL